MRGHIFIAVLAPEDGKWGLGLENNGAWGSLLEWLLLLIVEGDVGSRLEAYQITIELRMAVQRERERESRMTQQNWLLLLDGWLLIGLLLIRLLLIGLRSLCSHLMNQCVDILQCLQCQLHS